MNSVGIDVSKSKSMIAVTSFIHTMKVERARHKFSSAKETEGQYPNAYFNEVASRDSTWMITFLKSSRFHLSRLIQTERMFIKE